MLHRFKKNAKKIVLLAQISQFCRNNDRFGLKKRSKSGLYYRDFVDAALVSATFEGSVEIYIDDAECGFFVNEPGGHDKDVGIVVFACKSGDVLGPREGGADALVLVEGDVDAVACAAHCDAAVEFSAFDGDGAGVGKVGIVARLFGICAEVMGSDSTFVKMFDYFFLEFVTGVVTAKGDCHGN